MFSRCSSICCIARASALGPPVCASHTTDLISSSFSLSAPLIARTGPASFRSSVSVAGQLEFPSLAPRCDRGRSKSHTFEISLTICEGEMHRPISARLSAFSVGPSWKNVMRFYGVFAERRLDECPCTVSERSVFAAGTAHHGPRNVLRHGQIAAGSGRSQRERRSILMIEVTRRAASRRWRISRRRGVRPAASRLRSISLAARARADAHPNPVTLGQRSRPFRFSYRELHQAYVLPH